MQYVALAARVCLGLIFIRAGINHLLTYSGFVETISGLGVPLPALAAILSIAFLILGSLSLFLGFKTQIGAILLLLFLIPTTLVVHNPIADASQWSSFFQNLGLIGGLLMTVYAGPGRVSIDGAQRTPDYKRTTDPDPVSTRY